MIDNKELVKTVIEAIQDKKGKEIVLIDLSGLNHAISDYFIVCHGNSGTQVNAIAESVEEKVKTRLNLDTSHLEGIQNAQWVLIDFQDVIVHVFLKEYRDYYKLEELWGDAQLTIVEEE